MDKQVINALLLTTAAGLSTTIGSLMALFVKKPSDRFMSLTLGFSAGIMIYVSFAELLPEAIESIGFLYAHAAFIAGMIAMILIDHLIPHDYIGQHDHPEGMDNPRLSRTGLLIALGIGIHNFPEGMATFAGAVTDLRLGMAIALAIALHNIPEGIAVSLPVFKATGSRAKAFWWSFFSGLCEPLGAFFAFLIFGANLGPETLGWFLAPTAGVMVTISLDELIPTAKNFDEEHSPICGAILGIAVMAFSIWAIR